MRFTKSKVSMLAAVALAVVGGAVGAARADTIVDPISVTASSFFSGSPPDLRRPTETINGSGLSDGGASVATGDPAPSTYPTDKYYISSTTGNTTWLSNNEYSPTITWDLGKSYALTGFYLWNYNEANPGTGGTLVTNFGRGATGATISFSTDGTNFSGSQTLTFSEATSSTADPGAQYALTPVTAQYVSFAIPGNFAKGGGNAGNYTGLAEIRFLASAPEPATLGILALGGIGILAKKRRRTA